MQNKIVDFKLTFPDNLDYTALLNKIEISINEFDSNYPLREWGSGTKSLGDYAVLPLI
jgi:hypothetical protein